MLRFFFFAVFALLPLVHGCSMGFTALRPGENGALYAPLFEDVIGARDEPRWLWVRGAVAADLDGNGVVDEEAVLATIQRGDARRPGAVESAFLVAARVEEDGTRTALARKLLFDSSPVDAAPKPENGVGGAGDAPFTRCRAQAVRDKETFRESVVVYFWSDPAPSTAWYAGYALTGDGWEKNLEFALRQSMPGVLTANLDRSEKGNARGYQLVVNEAAVPPEITAKLGAPSEAPMWGHVYARGEAGEYEQADGLFAENYRELEPAWNKAYLKAVMLGLPAGELAWFEYHLALLNHFTGNGEMAEAFLRKAEAGAADPVLRAAIAKSAEGLHAAAF